MPDPDIPEAAVRAVSEVLRLQWDRKYGPRLRHLADFEAQAREILAAAAPVLADAVAAKILAHMGQHEPKSRLIGGKAAEDQRRQAWRRHFRIAAQVASLAFSTREDVLREAAEAIERGDIITCDTSRVGETDA